MSVAPTYGYGNNPSVGQFPPRYPQNFNYPSQFSSHNFQNSTYSRDQFAPNPIQFPNHSPYANHTFANPNPKNQYGEPLRRAVFSSNYPSLPHAGPPASIPFGLQNGPPPNLSNIPPPNIQGPPLPLLMSTPPPNFMGLTPGAYPPPILPVSSKPVNKIHSDQNDQSSPVRGIDNIKQWTTDYPSGIGHYSALSYDNADEVIVLKKVRKEKDKSKVKDEDIEDGKKRKKKKSKKSKEKSPDIKDLHKLIKSDEALKGEQIISNYPYEENAPQFTNYYKSVVPPSFADMTDTIPAFMRIPPPQIYLPGREGQIAPYRYPVPQMVHEEIIKEASENQDDQFLESGPPQLRNPFPPDHPEFQAQQRIILDHYWNFVKENPYNFSGWTLLLNHVETLENIEACRGVFNAFLPLYPYCYAYWKRYSELEKKFGHIERSLQILERGLEAIPLSIDLWLAYLNLFWEIHRNHDCAKQLMRKQCERAVTTAGLEFRSDALWEAYLEWELQNNNLNAITEIYRKIIATPTKLCNKHWDNFLQHIHLHELQKIISEEEYSILYCESLKDMGITVSDNLSQKTNEKITQLMKEKVVVSVLRIHEKTERDVEIRWKFEERIKRPYFHVKPLDQKQLRNWREYLDFEIKEGNHQRIVTLFERCLIACAAYEDLWCFYARYLELYALGELCSTINNTTDHLEDTDEEKERLFQKARDLLKLPETEDKPIEGSIAASIREYMSVPDDEEAEIKGDDEKKYSLPKCTLTELESRVLIQVKIDEPGSGLSLVQKDSFEAVREVYRRACIVHCPRKPQIRLQWASFEEEQNNLDKSKELINEVKQQFPELLLPRLYLIDLERRQNHYDEVTELYKYNFEEIQSKYLRSWFAIKYARFAFKILGKPDKALSILRQALKKDRSNARLYQQVLDVCYQRYPVDVQGFCAATELALVSKELSPIDKLFFAQRRVDFLEEFGNINQYRKALEEFEHLKLQSPSDRIDHIWRKNIGIQVEFIDKVKDKEKEKERDKDREEKRKKSLDKTKEKKRKKDKELKKRKEERLEQHKHHREEDSLEEGEERDAEPPKRHRKRRHSPSTEYLLGRKSKYIPRKELANDHSNILNSSLDSPEPALPAELPLVPDPAVSPYINVPEWFVREGGELVISETHNGRAILRYWPRFLTDKGNSCMFKCLRQNVKWLQKRIVYSRMWYALNRLVSWYGPCDYTHRGMLLPKNDKWSPELIDLLHRLNQFTGHEFNCCFLNLYRSGHDYCSWHCDDNKGLGRCPPVASVSLGAIRVFELARKESSSLFIRFPLFPGSLLVMEGAVQEDWMHEVPKDPTVGKAERINLTFWVMYDISGYLTTGK